MEHEEHALKLAAMTAKRFCLRAPAGIGFDDLFAAALLGAAKALARYDPARGVKFASFALSLIRGEVLEELRVWDHLPRSERQRARKEAKKDGMSPDWARGPVSLEVERHETFAEGEPLLLRDTLHDTRADTEAEALERLHVARWRHILSWLPPMERHVIRRHYYDGQTFRDIGKEVHRSENRIHQLAAQARERLAVWASEMDLAP